MRPSSTNRIEYSGTYSYDFSANLTNIVGSQALNQQFTWKLTELRTSTKEPSTDLSKVTSAYTLTASGTYKSHDFGSAPEMVDCTIQVGGPAEITTVRENQQTPPPNAVPVSWYLPEAIPPSDNGIPRISVTGGSQTCTALNTAGNGVNEYPGDGPNLLRLDPTNIFNDVLSGSEMVRTDQLPYTKTFDIHTQDTNSQGGVRTGTLTLHATVKVEKP